MSALVGNLAYRGGSSIELDFGPGVLAWVINSSAHRLSIAEGGKR
jgi:hypothetical protein